jgi:tetratricopeptide (TPR) repeat protein
MQPLELLVWIARVRGRLAEANRLTREAQAIRAGAGMPSRALAQSLDAVREDLWLRGKPAQAFARLNALFATHPIATLHSVDDRVDAVEAAALYAAAGRPDRARAILGAVMDASDSLARRATLPLREAALGEIALAEGRFLEAAAAFRRSDLAADGLPVSACVVCILPRLARAAERGGWADSARIFWERYVTTTSLDRVETDSWFLAMAYRRLGHLYAEAGDRGKAMEYDRRLAALWQGADGELRLP